MNTPVLAAAVRPSHLAPESFGGWSLWRDVECRTAGFPAAMLDVLVHADCGRASDELADALVARDKARADVLRDLRARTLALRARLAGDDADSSAREALASLQALARQAYRSGQIDASDTRLDVQRAATLQACEDALLRARASFAAAWDHAVRATHEAACALAAEDRLREAVTWQNPAAARHALDRLVQRRDDPPAKRLASESLVLAYAQRYCAKNDTIGFFGPEGWAHIGQHAGGDLDFAPGPGLLAGRRVYFEDWAIRAFASRLSADASLRRWQVPRRADHLRWDGRHLHLPTGVPLLVSSAEAAALTACDGIATAAEIADLLCADPFGDFLSEEDVFAVLAQLARGRRIDWRFGVPAADAWPECALRAQLTRIDDAALRASALGDLDRLEGLRAAVAASAGNADAVARASGELDDAFAAIAGVEPTRNAGCTYGARTVVYEDCRRDMHLTLADTLAARLQHALAPVLDAARWYCHEFAGLARAALLEVFEACAPPADAAGGARRVGLPALWLAAQPLFQGEPGLDVEALQGELVDRWAEAIGPLDPAAIRVRLDADDVRARAARLFHAPDCGWRSACHQSPDVMIAAADVHEIAAGGGLFVLGELHMGTNTLLNQSAFHQHARPGDLLAGLHADLGGGRFMPIFSREGSAQPIRVQPVVDPAIDIELCFAHDARPLSPTRALPMAALFVERSGQSLVASPCDRAWQADLLDVLSDVLSAFVVNRFKPFARAPHLPRISIGELVIQREAWDVPCGEFDDDPRADNATLFHAARGVWRAHGLPRRAFVSVPWEAKPAFVDFDSPGLVRNLARQVRSARARGVAATTVLRFTEMLPDVQELWLHDSAGHRYTSELRFVAVHRDDLSRHQSRRHP